MIWASIFSSQNCLYHVLISSVQLQWSRLICSGVSYTSCRTVLRCNEKGIMGFKHWMLLHKFVQQLRQSLVAI